MTRLRPLILTVCVCHEVRVDAWLTATDAPSVKRGSVVTAYFEERLYAVNTWSNCAAPHTMHACIGPHRKSTTHQAIMLSVCGQKRSLEYIQVNRLVLWNGRMVTQPKIDHHLCGIINPAAGYMYS